MLGSKKWIAREGRAGISRSGVGGADGERGEEVLGAAHGPDASSGRAAGYDASHADPCTGLGAEPFVLARGSQRQGGCSALAARTGRDLREEQVEVVDLGGATNVGRFLQDLRDSCGRPRLAGLYDTAEERYFRRGLERGGHGEVPDRARLEELGFFACETDLEDELIRALGAAAVESVIDRQGQSRCASCSGSLPSGPARWRSSCTASSATRSGCESTYARLLVEALDLDRVPPPLTAVLRQI